MSLIFSVSGLRGIVNIDLNPDIIFKYARVFGRFVGKGKVVIGRDTRKSGTLFRRAVIKALNSAGCSVIDLGIVPTPTVVFIVKKLKTNGGIIITASHNPIQWNALKFVSAKGRFLNEQEFKQFSMQVVDNDTLLARHKMDQFKVLSNGVKEHVDQIMSILKPGQSKFRVGVDAVNGAGSVGLPLLLEQMGCKVYPLNCTFSQNFPRRPEPIRENIAALCRFVKTCKLDLGFACDPDCDRLAIVDENGKAVGEEKTLVLATDYVLSKMRGNAVTNLSTTALMNYITNKYGAELYRTKVGEANVVSKMHKVNAIIGGEGNGGVIYPKINFTRDALVGAALIIQLLSERRKKVSEILATYPKYYMVKKKLRIPKERFENKKEKIIDAFNGTFDFTDGLRIKARDYWIHIRPSQTEPVVRIIGEARDKKKIDNYVSEVKNILTQY